MREEISKKASPRRDVVRIEKEGPWGRVEYVHHLSCGHQERRKRASKTPVIACTWCVVAEKQGEVLKSLGSAPTLVTSTDDDTTDPMHSTLAVSEREIAKLKANLASHFGVSLEAVDVIVEDEDGRLSISYGVIFLSAGDIKALLEQRTPQANS